MPAPTSSDPELRSSWVDYAKGIGIILVVVGHTLRGLQKTPVDVPGWEVVDAWIYAFHMPLFFFLAGLFLEKSCRQPLGAFIAGKARRILWPYFVWSFLQETLRLLGSRSALGFGEMWTIIYKPVMQFWFLYVLFLLLVLYAVWRKTGASWQAFVVLAFLLNISMAFGVNYGSWGVVYQMWINIPYLALGVLVASAGLLPRVHSLGANSLAAIVGVGYLLVAGAVWGTQTLPLAVPLAVAGIASSAALAEGLARGASARWIRTLGLLSLEIFVAHTIFSSGLRQALLAAGILNPAIHVGGGILIGLIGPVVLFAVCRRFHLVFLFHLPSPRPS